MRPFYLETSIGRRPIHKPNATPHAVEIQKIGVPLLAAVEQRLVTLAFGQLGAAAEAADAIVLFGHAAGTAERFPERLDLGRTRFVHEAIMSENRQTGNRPRR